MTDPISLKKTLNEFFDHIPKELHDIFDMPLKVDTSLVMKGKIKNTDQTLGIIVQLDDRQLKHMYDRRKIIKSLYNERGLANDLLDRISLMPLTIGYDPFKNRGKILNEWKQETAERKTEKDAAGEKNRRGRPYTRFAFLSEIVAERYELFGWNIPKRESIRNTICFSNWHCTFGTSTRRYENK